MLVDKEKERTRDDRIERHKSLKYCMLHKKLEKDFVEL